MSASTRGRIRKKDMDDLERLYGNGSVYVSDGKGVYEFQGHNFDIESLEANTGNEFWITGELVVALGYGITRARAISALARVAEKIANTPKKKFNPLSKL